MENVQLSVSDLITLINQTLDGAYPVVVVEGEVANFKLNHDKYVFFDIKDESGTLGCFMSRWQLRVPIEDGMKVVIRATPKLTPWGRFSLTVSSVRPSGDGALKKSFELLKAKLDSEGLFAPERKRSLPMPPRRIGVISSTQAAGYADFIKIMGERWGGVQIDVANVYVQGERASRQIIAALEYFNGQQPAPDVIVIIRGGGSADDLAAFHDEPLVRAVAASRVPVLTGIGHETDESLVDLVADVRAATPSHAAELLVPDRRDVRRRIDADMSRTTSQLERRLHDFRSDVARRLDTAYDTTMRRVEQFRERFSLLETLLARSDPATTLRRGYAIVRGPRRVGAEIEIETFGEIMKAKVSVYDKK